MNELPPLDEQTLELLKVPSTATLTTVLSKKGLWNTFVTGASPVTSVTRMVGQAYTLRYIPSRADLDNSLVFDNTNDPQRIAIEQVGPGDVLVIDARGDERAGTMGNILAARMVARGAEGIVTDGCFRDTPAIATMNIGAYSRSPHASTNKTVHHPVDVQVPVGCGGVSVYPGDTPAIAKMNIAAYSRSPHASTNKTVHHPVDVQVPVGCGGVSVYPGDILVGDEEGVVVIPRHLADEVAIEAANQEHREDFILARIEAGEPLLGTYPLGEQAQAAYEEYCQENPPPTEN